ncbi:MAG: hypothetical protein LUF92_09045 [Clostridiales bacterium]|nr:hypothetical protein [Clostridiales bacterium]
MAIVLLNRSEKTQQAFLHIHEQVAPVEIPAISICTIVIEGLPQEKQ